MKIYYAKNSRAVRTVWLANELGLDYELHHFSLGDKAMRGPDYLAVNPNGRVPTVEDGEVTISESTAIAQYLVGRYGDGTLAPTTDSPLFAPYLQWLHYAEGMIMPQMNVIVVETLFLPPERRSQVHVDRAMKLMNKSLTAVEAQLKGKDYLIGDFSAADTITGHACIMAARLGADMDHRPNTAAYIKRLQARPALQTAWDA